MKMNPAVPFDRWKLTTLPVVTVVATSVLVFMAMADSSGNIRKPRQLFTAVTVEPLKVPVLDYILEEHVEFLIDSTRILEVRWRLETDRIGNKVKTEPYPRQYLLGR